MKKIMFLMVFMVAEIAMAGQFEAVSGQKLGCTEPTQGLSIFLRINDIGDEEGMIIIRQKGGKVIAKYPQVFFGTHTDGSDFVVFEKDGTSWSVEIIQDDLDQVYLNRSGSQQKLQCKIIK